MENLYEIIEFLSYDDYYKYDLRGCVVEATSSVITNSYYPKYEHLDPKKFYAKPSEFGRKIPQSVIDKNKGRFFFIGAIVKKYEPEKEKIIMRSPEAIRQEVNEYARNIDPARLKTIPPGLRGKMVSELNKVFSSNENRRFIVGWLFTGSFANSVSTSDLTEAQIAGLLHWLQPEHQKTGWVVAPMFRQEAALVYAYVAKEHVQTVSWKWSGPKMKLSPSLLAAIGVK